MSRIFITGSADGLGQMAASLLVKDGHQVVLHARHENRGRDALSSVPGGEAVVTGDLSSIAETIRVAERVNKLGSFDAIIHNAGIGYREKSLIRTVDGLPQVFAVNSLAPYILTCLIHKPARLIYTGSGVHRRGDPGLKDLTWEEKPWNGFQAYADSKLHDIILAFAVARKWPGIYSNAVEPGWVATKMGGSGAPDDLEEGPTTQVWLATNNSPEALTTGKYFYHHRVLESLPLAADPGVQEQFITECTRLSGVSFPSLA